jgi:hypothetical protein
VTSKTPFVTNGVSPSYTAKHRHFTGSVHSDLARLLQIIFKEGPSKPLEVREALRIFSITVLRVVELLEKLVEG